MIYLLSTTKNNNTGLTAAESLRALQDMHCILCNDDQFFRSMKIYEK